jgi:steroid 5-alpha reductase family enzyme
MIFVWTLVAVVVVLTVTFAVARVVGRHSVVDVAWGLGFAVVAVVSGLLASGDPARRLLVTALTVIWGVRLAAHIAWRARGGGEDPRYEKLLADAPGSRDAYALRKIYLTQGPVLWFVSLPVQVAALEKGPLGLLAWIGTAVWLVGFVFETVGDFQLSRFRADPTSRGQVMDRGLWRYTRHPNYFGDACVWWGLFLIACDHWTGLLTVLSPVLMTFFLVKGTGKPLLEEGMKSTRPGYEEYAARTSGFVPLPPKRSRST